MEATTRCTSRAVGCALVCLLVGSACSDETPRPPATPIDRPDTGPPPPDVAPVPDVEVLPDPTPVTGESGDSLEVLATTTSPVETVGMALIDGIVITCGGFGLDSFTVDAVTGALAPRGAALSRCQNIVAGPVTEAGRVFYATHHGDAYVPTPQVHVLTLAPDGVVSVVDGHPEPGISFEGMAYDATERVLYVAAHGKGIYRFDVDESGSLALREVIAVAETANAYRMTLHDGVLFVADGEGGLKIVDPLSGALVGAAPTVGFAKDVVVTHGMALVAASSLGIEAFDVTVPSAPVHITKVFTWGSASSLSLFGGGDRVAVANWDDVTVIDTSAPQNLRVLGVDRVLQRPDKDPRVLAVTSHYDEDVIVAGDWLGLGTLRWRDDVVAPEFDVDRNHLAVGGVAAGETAAAAFKVINRGFLPLQVTSATSTAPEWVATPQSFTVEPGDFQTVTATFTAPLDGTGAESTLIFSTNDPDEEKVSMRLRGNLSGSLLGVGDSLDSRFDFLDLQSPDGQQNVSQLQGSIVVLAYFATF